MPVSLPRAPEPIARLVRGRGRAIAVGLGLALVMVALVRTAWTCDDAFITFRVLDNAVNGHGLRWNPIERVQVYTHPLWMFVLLPLYALTRDAYHMPLAVSAACTLVGLGWAGLRLASGAGAAALLFAAALSSMAFIDFSTSGLENALAHLLLIAYVARWRAAPTPRELGVMAGLAGLVVLNRLDHGLLVGPALLPVIAAVGPRAAWRPLAIGFAPLVAWELFALVYYGSLTPNTAWAKLATGIPAEDLRAQGLGYLENSLRWDPVTLVLTGVGAGVGLWRGGLDRWMALGALGTVAYVVQVGGDHMAGRFLTAPFLVGLLLLTRAPMRAWVAGLLLPGVVGLGLLARTPPLLSPPDLVKLELDPYGIADERGFYYRASGLLRPDREPFSENYRVRDGRETAKGERRIVVESMVGWYGYGAGADLHVVDPLGLTDPLLARLPMRAGGWRVGHYFRDIPLGYPGSVRELDDPDLKHVTGELQKLTREPLFTLDRFEAILAFTLRRHDAAIARYCARRCSILHPHLLRAEGREQAAPFRIPSHGVAIPVDDLTHRHLHLDVEPGAYTIELRRGDERVARAEIQVDGDGPFASFEHVITRTEMRAKPTSVRLFAVPSDGKRRIKRMELMR